MKSRNMPISPVEFKFPRGKTNMQLIDYVGSAFAAFFGASVGSFLNVVIFRLPAGKSIVTPPSHCPKCGSKIKIYENIPVLSYLFLKGRCGNCRSSISPRYPLVEALTAAIAVGLWFYYGLSTLLVVRFVFLAGLVAVSFIDFDHKIIPDSLSLGGIAVGFISSFFTPLGWRSSLYGIALGGGSLLLVSLAYYAVTKREGMGLGDVKLLAAIGAFLGWEAIPFTIFAASLVGSVIGIALSGKSGLKYAIPFGPFLAFGATLYLFFGPQLIKFYFGIFAV